MRLGKARVRLVIHTCSAWVGERVGDKLKGLKSLQSCLCYSYLNSLDHKSIFHLPTIHWKGYAENQDHWPSLRRKRQTGVVKLGDVYQGFPAGLYFGII